MRAAGFVGAVIGSAILCAALVGCAGASTGPDSAEGVAATTRATTTATPTAAPTSTPRTTPTPMADAAASGDGAEALAPETEQAPEASEPDATPAQCVDEQVALAYVARPQDSGAGQFFADLVFTNVSASDCSFDGWPGLVAEDADGAMLGGPALAEGGSPDLVVLAANGGVAIAQLHGGVPGAYDCPATTSTALRAFLSSDGAGPGVAVAQAIPVCSDGTSTLGLGPLTAG